MRRLFGALFVGLLAAAAASGHALYVVPAGDKVDIVFSDDLAPDARVKEATWKRLDKLALYARAEDGKTGPVKWAKGEHKLTTAVPAGTRVVYGTVDYGAFAKGDAKPKRIVFYPKAIVGPAPADGGLRPDGPGLDVVPVVEAGKVRFRVLAAGKPLAGVKVSVMPPEKKDKADATTDEAGLTPAFDGAGRFGVTARHEEATPGEANGQKYEATTHVATLVVDVR